MSAPVTLTDILASGELDGYDPGPPRGSFAGEIDRTVCASAHCDHCGHAGLTYRPFTSRALVSYRAYAQCPVCLFAIEF